MEKYIELLWADYVQALRNNVEMRAALDDAYVQIDLLRQQLAETQKTDAPVGKSKKSA